MGINNKKLTQILNNRNKNLTEEDPDNSSSNLKLLNEADTKKANRDFDKESKKTLAYRGSLTPGSIVTFNYTAIHKKRLEKYDSTPTVLVLHHAVINGNNYIYGVNFNWLKSSKQRRDILDFIIKHHTAKKAKELRSGRTIMKKHFNLMYKDLKSTPKLKPILQNNAFRMYIVRSPNLKGARVLQLRTYDKLFGGKLSQIFRARWVHNKALQKANTVKNIKNRAKSINKKLRR